MASSVAAAPAAKPAVAETTTFVDRFNRYVDWTSKNAIDVRSTFTIKTGTEADSLLTKVAKVVFALIASIALLPLALAGSAFSWVKSTVCGSKAANESEVKSETQSVASSAVSEEVSEEASVSSEAAPVSSEEAPVSSEVVEDGSAAGE